MKEKIQQLRAQGKTYSEIVDIVGCSKGTIAWHCSEKARANCLAKQRVQRKQDITDLKTGAGGKCQCCGYDKCLEVLHFHHKDEGMKLKVRRKNGSLYGVTGLFDIKGKKVAQQEAKKCLLVCANCHGEIHAGVRMI